MEMARRGEGGSGSILTAFSDLFFSLEGQPVVGGGMEDMGWFPGSMRQNEGSKWRQEWG